MKTKVGYFTTHGGKKYDTTTCINGCNCIYKEVKRTRTTIHYTCDACHWKYVKKR